MISPGNVRLVIPGVTLYHTECGDGRERVAHAFFLFITAPIHELPASQVNTHMVCRIERFDTEKHQVAFAQLLAVNRVELPVLVHGVCSTG